MASNRITVRLTDANADMVKNVAAILNKPVSEVISFCLKGSTNPRQLHDANIKNIKNFCREVQPTRGK